MADMTLWNTFAAWKKDCKWVDLTHELSPQTPHWVGFDAMKVEAKLDLDKTIFRTHTYTTVGQYGTHVDVSTHMMDGGRSLEQIGVDEMVMPLCVIDKSEAVSKNPDYTLKAEDITAWEQTYGIIPAGAFVVFRSGWGLRSATDMDNLDAEGNRHFPGWDLGALQLLVEKRSIGGIGHETSDTEAPITSGKTNYEVEYYILAQDRFQIELLANVEQCPPVGAIVFCTFPKVKGGTGFPARCFALCPRAFSF